jgi:hypothetical protein
MSWKTSIFGLMTAIGAALVAAFATGVIDAAEFPKWVKQLAVLMSIIGPAGMGWAARDNKVTSEQVKENEQKMKDNGTNTLMLGVCTAVLASGLLWILTGCVNRAVVTTGADGVSVTNFQKVVDVERVARLAGNAAQLGTAWAVVAHPETRGDIEAAVMGLQVLQDGKNYDPAAFAAVMQKLPFITMQGQEGAIYISVGVAIWDEAVQEAEPLLKKELVQAVLPRVLKGMKTGLGQTGAGTSDFEQKLTKGTKGEEGGRFLAVQEERELQMLPEVIMPQVRKGARSGQ